MRSLLLWVAAVAAGCSTRPDDIVGPFTGPTHRYVVDRIRVPTTNTQARTFGGDLDGEGELDNGLGYALANLPLSGNVTEHSADMIAAGAVASSLEIVADDLQNDPTVGVRYVGTSDSPYIELGGRMENGWFRSNLALYASQPGEAELHLPLFKEADPSLLKAIGIEMILVPDGSGGFEATIHGGVLHDDAMRESLHRGISQMIASGAGDYLSLVRVLDRSPHDWTISYDEVWDNSIVAAVLSPDLRLDGREALSFGFRAHLRPCPEGACVEGVPFDHCFDRVLDADETNVDCGGSCGSCGSSPSSCTNGRRDGVESDVDCGAGCPGCALGKTCYWNKDCASGQCGEPCVSDEEWGCWNPFGDWPSKSSCYPPAR